MYARPTPSSAARIMNCASLTITGPDCRDGHRLAALLELPAIDGAIGAHAVQHAAVRRDVARCLRLRMRVEVAGRGHDGGALLARDPHGGHVALEELAEVDARIVASRDEVAARVVFARDVEHDVRVRARECRELRTQ